MCNALVGVGRGALSGALARHTARHRFGGKRFQHRALPEDSLHAAKMLTLAAILAAAPLAIAIYAYVGYPLILWLVAKVRPRPTSKPEGAGWPSVTITVPVYNAASSISATLDRLLDGCIE